MRNSPLVSTVALSIYIPTNSVHGPLLSASLPAFTLSPFSSPTLTEGRPHPILILFCMYAGFSFPSSQFLPLMFCPDTGAGMCGHFPFISRWDARLCPMAGSAETHVKVCFLLVFFCACGHVSTVLTSASSRTTRLHGL